MSDRDKRASVLDAMVDVLTAHLEDVESIDPTFAHPEEIHAMHCAKLRHRIEQLRKTRT